MAQKKVKDCRTYRSHSTENWLRRELGKLQTQLTYLNAYCEILEQSITPRGEK